MSRKKLSQPQSYSLLLSKTLLLFSLFLFVCTATLLIFSCSERSRPFTTINNTNSPPPSTDHRPASPANRLLNTKTTTISSVHDGDTIYIKGAKESVRLIGIDAPELAYSYNNKSTKNECGALEAKEKLKELILKKVVVLTSDTQTNDKDIYNRLLRYVFLCPSSYPTSTSHPPSSNLINDCQDMSLTLIELGLVSENGFGNNYSKQKEYKAAELEAKNAKRGIWGKCQN